MLQNYNKYRVLQAFFDEPTTELQLREISRSANLATPSTKKYLRELAAERLITVRQSRRGQPVYVANTDEKLFKVLKQQNLLLRLEESGLLDTLVYEIGVRCIIFYGSASRGEDVEESDIDLYLEGVDREPPLDLAPYERRLRRKIHLLCSESFEKSSKEFKNNLVNAIVIRGYLRAFPYEPLTDASPQT